MKTNKVQRPKCYSKTKKALELYDMMIKSMELPLSFQLILVFEVH